jgi:hypothetical protein
MSILNEDNLEPNKPDTDYKGSCIVANLIQEINITSPILFTVHDTYLLLNEDKGGIKYISTESWKDIFPNYYTEIYYELQEKESVHGFNADNTSTCTSKYY